MAKSTYLTSNTLYAPKATPRLTNPSLGKKKIKYTGKARTFGSCRLTDLLIKGVITEDVYISKQTELTAREKEIEKEILTFETKNNSFLKKVDKVIELSYDQRNY